jgi:hypothetical protein
MFGGFVVKGTTFAESGRDILFVLIWGSSYTVLGTLIVALQKEMRIPDSDDTRNRTAKQLNHGIALVSLNPTCINSSAFWHLKVARYVKDLCGSMQMSQPSRASPQRICARQ